jgi:hypothetical protein
MMGRSDAAQIFVYRGTAVTTALGLGTALSPVVFIDRISRITSKGTGPAGGV